MPGLRATPKRLETQSLVTTAVDGDMLVYDLDRQHIHHLNPVAATVWNLCDGQRSIPAIAAAAASELGQPLGDEEVRMSLALLESAHLIESGEFRSGGNSRRAFLRKAAIGGTLIPAIASTTAPAAAQIESPTCDGQGDPVGEHECATAPGNRCCDAGPNCLGYCSDSICNPRWGTGVMCQPI